MSATSSRHRLWHSCARLTVLAGLVCATDEWGWQLALAGVVSAGFGCVILWLPFTESTFAAMRLLYRRGALGGVVVVAVVGLFAVGGLASGVLVLMLVGSSPHLRGLVRRRWPSLLAPVPQPSAAAPPDVVTEPVCLPAPDDLSALDDPALCLAWRHTFVALQASRSTSHRLRVVRQREAILDELQRRCPAGFDAWLAAGARAPSNPLPFVRPPRSRAEDPPSAG